MIKICLISFLFYISNMTLCRFCACGFFLTSFRQFCAFCLSFTSHYLVHLCGEAFVEFSFYCCTCTFGVVHYYLYLFISFIVLGRLL